MNKAPASTSLGRSGGRSLAQLMKLHAEQGKDISLTADEEERLEAELGKWVRLYLIHRNLFLTIFFKDKCGPKPVRSPRSAYRRDRMIFF